MATPTPWINEIHYDNVGADQDEGFEIAGWAGEPLDGWSVWLYSGANGASYDQVQLSGEIGPDDAVWFPVVGLQNGAPDGLALVDPMGAVVERLSYEGSFVAADGPAAGLSFDDIGVREDAETPAGLSLSRTGTGFTGADFHWAADVPATPGTLGSDQVLLDVP